MQGVYPRTHGGTDVAKLRQWDEEGLSPHTRGNLAPRSAWAAKPGSIPAHTGEPRLLPIPVPVIRVYPRTHGGTHTTSTRSPVPSGLSPHTRGNHSIEVNRHDGDGSIPAHTGEPRPGRRRSRPCGVYPRTHGGTFCRRSRTGLIRGLSPHTRGNPCGPCRETVRRGSIPAHTGEPRGGICPG